MGKGSQCVQSKAARFMNIYIEDYITLLQIETFEIHGVEFEIVPPLVSGLSPDRLGGDWYHLSLSTSSMIFAQHLDDSFMFISFMHHSYGFLIPELLANIFLETRFTMEYFHHRDVNNTLPNETQDWHEKHRVINERIRRT